jgi:hypothetical protein
VTDTLAQYTVAVEPDERRIRRVTAPRLFATRYPAPQPFLSTLAAVPWRPALRLPQYRARRQRLTTATHVPLFSLDNDRQEEA